MICNRRTFFAAASGLALGTRMATAKTQGANDRVRVGVIGTGGRARGLMNHLKRLPGNELVAICDVYEPRMLQAAALAIADLEIELIPHGLTTGGFDTNCWNLLFDGATPLYVAAKVQYLVDHGADVRAKTTLGWTPLNVAAGSPPQRDRR